MAVKPMITLEIEEKTWEEFKGIITKDKTLNEAVVELIQQKIKNK